MPPRHALRSACVLLRAAGAIGIGVALAWLPPAAFAQDERPKPPSGPQTVYLEVSLNGESTGLLLRFTEGKDGLRSSVDNLRQLGLDPARLGLGGQDEVDLKAVPGLSYDYDPAGQRIALRLADAVRPPLALSARSQPKLVPAQVTPGALLNYDAYVETSPQSRLALYHEARYFDQHGVFSSTGTLGGGAAATRRYLRYDTSWSHATPGSLETLQLGDLVSSALSWSRSLRLAGIQWRNDFSLQPGLVTYPVASVNGSAALPSALSLYVNGIQQFSANVPSGPFVVNQVAGINGAGQATVLTRDALGRSVSTTLPLYVDTRLLAAGLSDYGVEAGVPRLNYGSSSFGYRAAPMASASWRHGVSDRFTAEAHGEVAGALYNAGAGALYRIGMVGVVNGTVSLSAGAQRGAQAGFGYQYAAGRFSVEAQTLRASRNYADLAAREGAPATTVADRATLNLALFDQQNLSLSYVGYRSAASAPAQIVSLAYSLNLTRTAFFSLSAFQDLKQRQARGLFASLSVSFDNRVSATASGSRQNGAAASSLSLMRMPDIDGGAGWSLQSGQLAGAPYQQAQLQYLGNYGQLSAITQHNSGERSSALDLSGAVVLMDHSVFAARQVGAGFALVSTRGVADVPVLHEHREIGATNAGGHLLIPNLNAYGNNAVGIDPSMLPANVRVGSTEFNVVPQRLAGVLVTFPIERYRAATVLVHGADGKPLPLGQPVRHLESGGQSVVGYDGQIFVEGLRDINHLEIGAGAQSCEVEFDYHDSDGAALPVLGPLLCQPRAAEER